jgi:hypothetical protein
LRVTWEWPSILPLLGATLEKGPFPETEHYAALFSGLIGGLWTILPQPKFALIQVLALDPKTHRSEANLKIEAQCPPRSSDSWTQIAADHPEFFRVKAIAKHLKHDYFERQ